MVMVLNLAVFGSGRGSNFQAILQAIDSGSLDAKILVVISDKENARILELARNSGIPAYAVSPKGYDSRRAHEQAILEILRKYPIEFIVLAGYMRIITPYLLNQYPNRFINIHPSLLPSFKGLHAQRQALEYGVKVTGATVHLVNEEVDAGKILAQKCVPVLEDDTEETLSARILEVEHELLPTVLQEIAIGKIKIELEGMA
ncbi:MAG: phosphoribosylglycinamide formyltransferase [Methanobacteriota archaeon]|nr:MAG: phosphoribosylglycinamide formyltransferase [Euryarchaeota archaeon]